LIQEFPAMNRDHKISRQEMRAITPASRKHDAVEPASAGIPERDRGSRHSARRRRHVEDLLDAALEDTFPASDPIAIGG
jgi:hypothetical protein